MVFGFGAPVEQLDPVVENVGLEDGWMVSANFMCVFMLGVLHTQLKCRVYVCAS